MALNIVWLFFFLSAFVAALVQAFFFSDWSFFAKITQSIFSSSKTGFEIALGLTGLLSFWLGMMKVAEKAGLIDRLARLLTPLFRHLFPQIPEGHPVFGYLMMNIAANMLGLDNAATPVGLKAMKELQELNPNKDEASDSQVLFLVLNTSGLTLIPVSIITYRMQLGANDPADVFLPILLSTFVSTLVGLLVTSFFQKINLLKKAVLIYLGSICLLISGLLYALIQLPKEQMQTASQNFSYFLLFSIIALFLLFSVKKKNNVYEDFIEGAKEGFSVAILVIPYLVAILAAIAAFRASGVMDFALTSLQKLLMALNISTQGIEALPVALMKPLSGSGARGLMVEATQNYGADSFIARLAATFQGSTDTTFYILAVYFGSVGLRRTRHAVPCGLIADFAGIVAAIIISHLFWGA